MKSLGLVVVGFFCLLSVYGEECGMAMLTYDDWLRSEETQPFQAQPFLSNSELIAQQEKIMLFAASASGEYTELGGLERELDIEDGTFILLLLSLGYCFKCYKDKGKIKVPVSKL